MQVDHRTLLRVTAATAQAAGGFRSVVVVSGLRRRALRHIPSFVTTSVNQRIVLRQARIAQQVAVGAVVYQCLTLRFGQAQCALQVAVECLVGNAGGCAVHLFGHLF